MAIENYIIFNVNLNGGSEWSKRDTILQAKREEHPRKETMNGTRDISTLIGRVLAMEERGKRRVGQLNFAAWFCRRKREVRPYVAVVVVVVVVKVVT